MPEPGARPRWKAPVRVRVTAAAAVAALVVLTAVGVAVVVLQQRVAVDGVDESLEARLDALAVTVGRVETADSAMQGLDDDLVVQVVAPDGTVTAGAGAGEPTALVAPASRDGTAFATRDGIGGGDDDGPYRVAWRRAGTTPDASTLVVGLPLDDVDETTRALVLTLAVVVPAATALLAATTWWLVGRALAPVEALRAEVASIGGRDLDRRVPEPATGDEIGRLARTMNAMLTRLQDARARQDRFVADASHELRTPLTRMRSELEVDLTHAETADREATERSVLEEVAALQALVDDLLLLARLDAAPPTQPADVPLDALVAEEVAAVGAPHLELAVDATPVIVRGDERELRRVVRNLLANAARHGRSRVDVAVGPDAGEVVLSVVDDGPGIAPEDRERVFERFTRLDDARSAASGGAGLGLAIVRELVERHGGTVVVADAPGPAPTAGAALVVRLPRAPAPARERI